MNEDARWEEISAEYGTLRPHINNAVVLDAVLRLSAGFEEDCVSPNIVYDVVLDPQVVDLQQSHSSIERVVDRAVPEVGVVGIVEMGHGNGVATNVLGLTSLGELDVRDPECAGLDQAI